MKQETIKIGDKVLEIANGSCSLDKVGESFASVAILIGSNSIDDIRKALNAGGTITKYNSDGDGDEEWKRDNLVFTGRMHLQSSFPIGIKQESYTDSDGNEAYRNVEVMGDVVVVEYRLPTIQDEVKELRSQNESLNAKFEYLSMMSNIEMEVTYE